MSTTRFAITSEKYISAPARAVAGARTANSCSELPGPEKVTIQPDEQHHGHRELGGNKSSSQVVSWFAEGQGLTIDFAGLTVIVRYVGRKGRRARIAVTAPPASVFHSLGSEDRAPLGAKINDGSQLRQTPDAEVPTMVPRWSNGAIAGVSPADLPPDLAPRRRDVGPSTRSRQSGPPRARPSGGRWGWVGPLRTTSPTFARVAARRARRVTWLRLPSAPPCGPHAPGGRHDPSADPRHRVLPRRARPETPAGTIAV